MSVKARDFTLRATNMSVALILQQQLVSKTSRTARKSDSLLKSLTFLTPGQDDIALMTKDVYVIY